MDLGIKFIVVPFHICEDGSIVAGGTPELFRSIESGTARREILAADPC